MSESPPHSPRDASRLVFGYLTGYLGTHLMNAGIEMGLFAALNGYPEGVDADTLANALDLHAPYVEAWLQGAYALELVDTAPDGRFIPAAFMNLLLGNDESMMDLGPFVRLFCGQMESDAALLPELYRSGAVHTYQDKGDTLSALVADATQHFGRMTVAEAVPRIPGLEAALRAGGEILDMGCGSGRVVAAQAEAYPASRVLGVDIDPYGVERANAYLRQRHLHPRASAELMHGAELGHENAFDLVTMVLVLHECQVEHRAQIGANCYRALKPGGALLIVDENYPARQEDARKPKHQFAVLGQWLEATMGNVFVSAEEQIAYLVEHGFRDVTQVESQTGLLLTWGLKPE